MRIQTFYEVPFDEYFFKDRVRTTPEEKVRQWILHELVKIYNYPKEWMGNRILIEWPVQMGSAVKSCDIAILNAEGEPFILIETKQELVSDQGKEQLRSYLAATYTANIGMWSNGRLVQCYRKMRDPNRVINEPDIPLYEPGKGVQDRRKYTAQLRAGTNRNTGQLQVFKGKQFEDFLFRCHSVLRDEDGLQPDEAVDEMIKLLYIKSYDELFIPEGKDFRFQEFSVGSTEELTSNILSLYKESQEEERKRYENDPSRAIFDEDLIIKSSTIRQIVQLLQGYSIVDSSSDAKGRAFERFLSKTFRKGLGQYFTPEPVVDILVGILDPTEYDIIIDPACGSARMLTHCIEHVKNKYKDEKQFQKFCLENTRGIDIARKLTRIAAIDAWMHEDGKKVNVDVLNMDGLDDFEKYQFDKEYATIAITNPPFGSNITNEATLRRFSVAYKNGRLINSLPKEVLFLNRCFELVKPGGKIGIVLPDGVLANSNMKFIRDWYREQCKLVAVVSLPQETFMPFGAGVKASLVFFRKWTKEELKQKKMNNLGPLNKFFDEKNKPIQDNNLDDYGVYMARVDNIGYDATGREKGKSEVDEIVKDFHQKHRWS